MYIKNVEIRWSDLDPNFHLRHSVYYDWGAYSRISFLTQHGLTPAVMMQLQIGPIIFREEAVFKKEIKFGDSVEINLKLAKCREDMSRWTIIHEIYKNKETQSAIVTVDGAWIDTQKRKLGIPPLLIKEAFNIIPKTENFEWIQV